MLCLAYIIRVKILHVRSIYHKYFLELKYPRDYLINLVKILILVGRGCVNHFLIAFDSPCLSCLNLTKHDLIDFIDNIEDLVA
jgi:hypothetical protein